MDRLLSPVHKNFAAPFGTALKGLDGEKGADPPHDLLFLKAEPELRQMLVSLMKIGGVEFIEVGTHRLKIKLGTVFRAQWKEIQATVLDSLAKRFKTEISEVNIKDFTEPTTTQA